MRKRKKRVSLFFIKFLIIVIIGVGIFFVYKNKSLNVVKAVDDIKGFNYKIENRDTSLMKDNFKSLKDVLQEKDIDYEKYAEYLSKLFVIDLYTLDNKNNKYDVGGVEYVYPANANSFKLKVQDTLYKYLEDSTDRNQKLPVVSNIKIESTKKTTYEYEDKNYDAFEVQLSWQYKHDYGYDNSATITLMKDNKYLYIVEFVPEVDE